MHEFGTVCGLTQEVRVNALQRRLSPLVPFPHRHDFYHLVIVTSGQGWHEIDFERYPVRAHQVYSMKPGQVHSWQMSGATSGYVIEFGEEAVSELWPERAAPGDPRRIADHFDLARQSAAARERFYELNAWGLDEYEKQAVGFATGLRHWLVPLLIALARFSASATGAAVAPDGRGLDPFYRLIEENFHREHEVLFYAIQLKMTAKALTMKTSRATGKSARTLIQARCLLEAKRLLAYSNRSVAEVGYDIGFEDPNYFSRYFKASAGITPGDFRKASRRSTP